MGISAAIAGIGAATTAASTISNIAGGGSPSANIGSAVGTGISAASQLQAGQIQQAAAEKAIAQQEGTTQATTNALLPFANATAPIEGGLTNLLGAGPSGPAGMLTQLQATPGYQFALTQGLQATKSQLSSMGLADSGSAIKGAAQYAEGLAGTTYQGIVSNYLNAGQQAMQGATNYGNIYQAGQNAQNNLILNSGAAQASGIVGAANVLNSGLNNLNAMNPAAYPGGTNPGTPYLPGSAPGAAENTGYNTNDLYDVNQIAMQNPYQIQAPQINPQIGDINALMPTLPTG